MGKDEENNSSNHSFVPVLSEGNSNQELKFESEFGQSKWSIPQEGKGKIPSRSKATEFLEKKWTQ